MRTPHHTLIVLAAGAGKRMKRPVPKMLLRVHEKPLLYWALKNIAQCQSIHSVVLVSPTGCKGLFQRYVKAWRMKKVVAVVEGGKERQDSTRNAMRAVPEEATVIGIHDGARAFVPSSLVTECFKAAEKYGAALLAVPSKDTIKLVDEKLFITRTPPRSQCWGAQTPQVFRRDIARKIHPADPKKGSKILKAIHTDDASLAESLGYKVKIVPSSYENLKITTPEDLVIAESILRRNK